MSGIRTGLCPTRHWSLPVKKNPPDFGYLKLKAYLANMLFITHSSFLLNKRKKIPSIKSLVTTFYCPREWPMCDSGQSVCRKRKCKLRFVFYTYKYYSQRRFKIFRPPPPTHIIWPGPDPASESGTGPEKSSDNSGPARHR